jgi:cation diffusion facilitator CzcD-associated flavoprotein CzcO
VRAAAEGGASAASMSSSSSSAKQLRVGVVGAGVSGCALAFKLKEAVAAPAFV